MGVEADASEAFGTARRHGRITAIDPRPTIADGLGGNLEPGAVTFDYVEQYVHDIVAVDEAAIIAAVGDLAGREHQIAEGAAASPTWRARPSAWSSRERTSIERGWHGASRRRCSPSTPNAQLPTSKEPPTTYSQFLLDSLEV